MQTGAQPLVISQSDFERIKASIRGKKPSYLDTRRKELKAKSDERVARWSNTLSAMREKKLLWKKERLEREEMERRKKDEQEAELQHRERMELLEQAHSLLIEQTDFMKQFRSAQLYSDVLATRERQTREMRERKAGKTSEKSVFEQMNLEQMAAYDAKEAATLQKVEETEKELARLRRERIEEGQRTRAAEKEADKAEGIRILEQAKREVEEDKQKARDQVKWHRDNAQAMTQANVDLQKLRAQLAADEAKEDEKIAACVKQKEATAFARKEFERERFEAKQALRKEMIDRACAELTKQTNNENAIMEKQAQEQRDKEDAELARRAEKAKRQQQAIEESRLLHQQLREVEKQRKAEAGKQQRGVWAQTKVELQMQEQEAKETRYQRDLELAAFHKQQIELDAKRREEARLSCILGEAQARAIAAEDKDRFTNFAMKEIEKARQAGKPYYPMMSVVNSNSGIRAAVGA